MRSFLIVSFLILISPGLVVAKTQAIPSNWTAHRTSHVLRQVMLPSGYTPQQIRTAYAITADGAGAKVAIVDAYATPKAASDLAVFSAYYHLPILQNCNTGMHPCLEVVNQAANHSDAGWQTETVLDLEWAHAIAPQADLTLVSAANDSLPALLRAVDVAQATNPQAISMSWGGKEFATEVSESSHFTSPTISFVAAAGDDGSQVLFPGVLPSVVSVGGTTLQLRANGTIQNEVAWLGSGGGKSNYLPKPVFQKSIPGTNRMVPDVAYNADPNTGYSIYSSSEHGWAIVGGTSAGAPQWAAILASGKLHDGATVPARLYTAPASFHDILTGKNGKCGAFCTARGGYDTVTGLGSPDVRKLSNILY